MPSAKRKQSAEVIPFPATAHKRGRLRRSHEGEKLRYAAQNGYKFVSQKEQKLLELLRHTSFEGREVVYLTAAIMRETKPWTGC